MDKEEIMKLIKSIMGRREFLLTAGAASTSVLAASKLAGFVDPHGIANAAETSGTAAKGSGSVKCVVIYFSMTGNTEKVAKAIQKGLEQAAGNCDIFPIKEANPHKLAGYDLIAFGYPLMGPMLKTNIINFIDDLRYVGGKHMFLFSTSDSGGNNFPVCVPKLKEHGLIPIGYKAWRGSVYGPLGDPTPSKADGHPDKTDLEDAEAFGKEMVESSKKIYAGDKSLVPPEPVQRKRGGEPPELAGSENDTNEQYMKRVHFKLVYDQSKCLYPKCQRCMDFCPVYGIDMTVEPRVIGKPCMLCQMCDQLCPTGAISIDPEQMIWQAEIEHYAEKGVKQVYQVYTKHPRFVIGYGRPYGYDPYTKEDRGTGK
jgi:flavodoxin/NAD-dependent dihydropyrimidine dehydrogenase PreA subunit